MFGGQAPAAGWRDCVVACALHPRVLLTRRFRRLGWRQSRDVDRRIFVDGWHVGVEPGRDMLEHVPLGDWSARVRRGLWTRWYWCREG